MLQNRLTAISKEIHLLSSAIFTAREPPGTGDIKPDDIVGIVVMLAQLGRFENHKIIY